MTTTIDYGGLMQASAPRVTLPELKYVEQGTYYSQQATCSDNVPFNTFTNAVVSNYK